MGGMLEGKGLYDLLVELTGLERNIIESELESLMKKLEINREKLRVEDLRRLAALYLEDIHKELLAVGLQDGSEICALA